MKLIRDAERRLEQLFESASRMLGGDLHPAELGARLAREADLAVEVSPRGPRAPNVYVLELSQDDFSHLPEDELTESLAALVEATSAERGWRLDGPARVQLRQDSTVSPGQVRCICSFEKGLPLAWARLTSHAEALAVHFNRSVIGRDPACDLVIPRQEVSRRHAMLWRETGAAWVDDLGSTNGTFINGGRVKAPTRLPARCLVTLGSATFTYDPV